MDIIDREVDRREFLQEGLGAVAAATLIEGMTRAGGQEPGKRPHNVILIISDQEAYGLHRPKNYELPARAELRRRGTTFERHYIASAMCTPSRGAIFSGQPPQLN